MLTGKIPLVEKMTGTLSGLLKYERVYLGMFKNKPSFSGSGYQKYKQLSRTFKYLLGFVHLEEKQKGH